MRRRLFITLFGCFLLGLLALPVHAADLNSQAGVVSTNGGRLNIRSGPSTDAAAVAALNKGNYVTLLSQSGSWWRVEYAAGKYGYCHGDYITPAAGAAATVATNGSALNVRGGPGTGYTKTGTLKKGETAVVLSTSSGWSRILYHGTKTGYVSAQYLSGTYAPVSLWVPDMKQTDSRWAEKEVGTSGKTFAQIGCATTAVAMVESHRTGNRIYPDAMSQKLRYTADGSLYWPDHYSVVTAADGYLRGIYDCLRAGKPVLLGARNGYGKQHWVVVTGFTGGSSLSASAFTVQDPGSSSRKDLQQFLDVYPVFYKYFYY